MEIQNSATEATKFNNKNQFEKIRNKLENGQPNIKGHICDEYVFTWNYIDDKTSFSKIKWLKTKLVIPIKHDWYGYSCDVEQIARFDAAVKKSPPDLVFYRKALFTEE